MSTPKPKQVIARHADFIDEGGIRCCSCGTWETETDGQLSRVSFAGHVLAALSSHGYSIVPSSAVTEREDILSAIRDIINAHPGGEVVIDELRGFLRALALTAAEREKL